MPDTRILEFSTYAKIGGTQKMLLEFLRHASHEKYEYHMCVLLEHDSLNDEVSALGIPNISLNMRGYWDLSAWWKLYRFAKDTRFDLIRSYGLKADIIGRIVGKASGIPVNITSVRSTDPWRKWYHVLLDALSSPLTDLYLSNSEAGRLAVCRRERIEESRTLTIPNGIDLERFHPEKIDTERVRAFQQEWDIRPETKVIGLVANLCTMKGHKTLIDALQQVRQTFPDIKCLFVGTDFLNGDIQRYVKEQGAEDIVIFSGFQQHIPEVLALLDVFTLPSEWEGLPTALLEAMAMGVPVVASNVGGIPEAVEHERSGLLVPPKSPDELAKALTRCLEHSDFSQQMGHAGRQRIRSHFTLPLMVSRTEALYAELIEQHKAKDSTR